MSPEKENDHSSDKLDSTDSLKGKEISSWLLNLLSDRVLPLSSHSRINLSMPPIASSIWRRIGHLSPQVIHLPILQRASIPILTKAPSLSTVWRRLLDLPLLRRRQKRTNEFIRASHNTYAGGKWSANAYMSPDETVSNEYYQGIPTIGEGQFTIEPIESSIGGHIQRLPLVAEGHPVDAVGEVYPTFVDDVPTRPADIAKEPYKAESPEKSVYPSSVVEAPEQVIGKSISADASKSSLLPIDRTTSPESEQPGHIQEFDLRDIKHTEDVQPGPGEKPQPEYKSQDLTGISSSPSGEPDLEYVGRMLPHFNEQLQPASSSQGLGSVQLPITEEPVVSSDVVAKPSIATRLSTPLVQSLPVLQRLYLKARDKAVELGSKVMQLPYTVGNLSARKAPIQDKKPVTSLDSYEPTSSQSVDDNLVYPSPYQVVPAESEAISSRYQPIEQPVVIDSVYKPVPDMLSPGAEKHDANLTAPGSGPISRRLIEVQQAGKNMVPLSPLTPLIEQRVERFKTRKADEDLDDTPKGMGTVTPYILPAGEADVPAEYPAGKPEMLHPPMGLPSTSELHREVLPESEGDAGITVSPVPKYFGTVRDVPVESSVRHGIIRREVKKPVSSLPGRIYRSLELLLTSPVKSGAVLNAKGIEGVSTRSFEGRTDYLSQKAIEPESSFEGYSEAVSPELSAAQTRSYTKAIPPELSIALAGNYTRAVTSKLPVVQTRRYSEAVPPELPLVQTRRYSEAVPPELPLVQTRRYSEAMSPELPLVQTRRYSEAMSPELPLVQTRRYSEAVSPELPLVQTRRYTEPVLPKPVFIAERGRAEPALPEPEIVSKKSQTEEISLAAARTEGVAKGAVEEEEAALDLDDIARDVYRILKRRLYRERERAFGLS